jgi:hypothetical protein
MHAIASLRGRWLALGLPLLIVACSPDRAAVRVDTPEMAAFIELMMPQRIEIQKFSQPISVTGTGRADAVEVIIAAIDATGDNTKITGTFQFELHRRQLTSGLRISERVAYWRVPVLTAAEAAAHWDRYARFYRFPLKLEGEALPPDDYVLKAQLTSPTGEHLFDEYVVRFDGSPVPPLEPRY